jgi:2-keto-4-pentenoate hydratase
MTPDTPLSVGMGAQLGRRDAELVAGALPLGWKLGLTIPAVQRRLGLDGPVVGYLSTATDLQPGSTHSLAGTTAPAAEPEVAIHLGADVPPAAGPDAAGAAIAGLGAAVEIVDVDAPLDDLQPVLAGNVFHRAVMFGPAGAGDTGRVAARVLRNGEEAGAAEAEVDAPAVVAFVSRFLHEYGIALRAGERIIAGSLTEPVALSPGDRIEVDVAPLGALWLTVAD